MTKDELLKVITEVIKDKRRSLNLNGNQLTELPPEIGQLTTLRDLHLDRNQLTELPPEIGQLTGLTHLSLNGNKLAQLPSEIGQLTGLTDLYVSDNQLAWLPPQIARLTKLRVLDLEENEFKALPSEIMQLSRLEVLNLGLNLLRELPPEIGRLTNLTWLTLASNQLTKLPPNIARLKELQSLNLGVNRLRELPPEIGQLTALTWLSLMGNGLTVLPPELTRLAKLQWLDLEGNQIEELPPEIERLTKLTRLYLSENPLPVPPEILAKTDEPKAIINYYFQHRAGQKKPLNEAKMLVVGQGSVGKTSLVRLLTEGKFDPGENKTEGIDIRPWQIEVNNQNVRLNVWDFGGQEIMHATHQFFLTKRSLYVLVLDARLGEEENRLEYWLKIIQSFGKDSPVIVVGNKVDQQGLDLDRRGLQAKYPNIKAFVETSCPESRGIDELKTVITREVGALEHIHDQLLANWFAVKESLEQMKEDYIPFQDYVRLCREKKIDDEISQNTLIGFLHDLGLVLNFRGDPRLKETNILNPEWVTNGVYKILNSNLLFQSKGTLERQSLGQILDERKYPEDKHLFIMDMMRKFELCYDFADFRDEKFLIPDLLTKEEPDTGDWGSALAFQYHYGVLPTSIISRFIVRMQQYVNQNTLWRTGVVLKNGEGNRALVKADIEDRKIFIWVAGPENSRRRFLEVIRSNFDSIHLTIPGLVAAEKVPLPSHPEIAVDYEHLLRLEVNNIAEWIPEGLVAPENVKLLLDGIETEQSRRGRQENRSKEDKREPLPAPLRHARQATTTGLEPENAELLQVMTDMKSKLDANSERFARRCLLAPLGLLLAVGSILAYLIYKFTWDKMEPWTYFIGFVAVAGSYGYFAVTLKEFSPGAIYEHLIERKKLKNYADAGFDLDKYKRLAGHTGA
ncbi:MAG: internalin [Pyrinomonadaceae bacterium]|nr:internalin [Pyrinomonadaceae bacterium]